MAHQTSSATHPWQSRSGCTCRHKSAWKTDWAASTCACRPQKACNYSFPAYSAAKRLNACPIGFWPGKLPCPLQFGVRQLPALLLNIRASREEENGARRAKHKQPVSGWRALFRSSIYSYMSWWNQRKTSFHPPELAPVFDAPGKPSTRRLIPRFALLTLAGELWINSAPTGAGTFARPGVSAVKSKAETAWMSKKRMGQMHSACAPIRFFEESGVSARPPYRARRLLGKMPACTHPRRGARPWPAACRWQTQPLPDHTPAWRCAARANG